MSSPPNNDSSALSIREWALSILTADTLEDKLYSPKKLLDDDPGPALFIDEPTRPGALRFVPFCRKKHRLPKAHEFSDQDKVATCLHRFAGHELLAVEIMAHALLAFPEAPKHFRKAVANTLKEEQEHVRLYKARLEAMGIAFGDMPLFKHFWSHVPHFTDPLKYISAMHLTFEMANLDFAPYYEDAFARHGDTDSAALMAQIFHDEISHVATGYHWLKKLKPIGLSDWEAYLANLSSPPCFPKKFLFQEQARKQAGLSTEWIANLSTN